MRIASKFSPKVMTVIPFLLMCALVGGIVFRSSGSHVAHAAGATLPYVELEAESAATNGTIIGPDRTLYTIPAESSGRRAITLSANGQYVQFTLPQQANSIVVRYSIPDTSNGSVYTAPLAVYINGTKQADLTLTNKYSWFYGTYSHGSQVWTNTPSDGSPHHFYDEVRMLLPQMAQNATVRLQKDSSAASSITIDLADFEQVPAAISQPGGSTSVISFGADPTGVNDSTAAIQNAINGGGTIWIPTGTYKCGHLNIPDNVTIRGAGVWYTTLTGFGASIAAPDSPARNNVHVSDLSLFGDDPIRDDALRNEGIAGGWTNSGFSNIWVEHTKVGIWAQPGTTSTTFNGFRIRDVMADGVNFGGGVVSTTVTQSMIRNTGDDGMALWSWNISSIPDHDNTFSYNTVQMPNLANNIAVYGGYSNTISNNYVADTLWNGGGIHFGNRFSSVAFSGTNTITGNTLVRTGSFHKDNNYPAGAIWFFAADAPISTTVNVTNNQINDSSYSAIQFVGSSVSTINFNTNTINGTGTFVVQAQTSGTANFTSVTASAVGSSTSVGSAIYNCNGFTINNVSGNGSWITNTAYCGSWPTPIYTDPSVTPTPSSTPTRTPTPLGGTVVWATNAGGPAVSPFSADTGYNQGNTFSDTSTTIDTSGNLDPKPAPQQVYQDVRWFSSFAYTATGLTANQNYTVVLHFAELSLGAVGARKFNVAINGSTVLTDFDVYAAAGSILKKAVGRAFTATANGSGQIVISFTQGGADNPMVSAIEILSSGSVTPSATPTKTNTPTITPMPTKTNTPTLTPTGGGSLPSPWATADVGAVAAAGSVSYSGGTFTVNGSGADIWDTADEFRYVYQTLNGDGAITARVVTQGNTNGWAKAGVMIRETTAAGAKHAMMVLTPSNGLAFQCRTVTGGTTNSTSGGAASAPRWVRVVRSGSVFTTYASADGIIWTNVGSVTMTMTSSVTIGLVVTSHNDGTLSAVTFDNVSVYAGAFPGTPYGGTAANIPGTVQAENFNNGGEGVAYHDLETANNGGQYRTSEGVDIEGTSDTGGGYNIGWTRSTEWLNWTVNATSAGTRTIDFRVANGTANGSFYLEIDGVNVTGTMTVPNTGGWQTWQIISKTGVTISAGQHVFRLVITGDDTNFNWIQVR